MLSLFRIKAGAAGSLLFDNSKPDDANDDQVDRHDVVEQTRHDQNQDAGDKRHDGLQVGDADGHGCLPAECVMPGHSPSKTGVSALMAGYPRLSESQSSKDV